MTKRVAGRRVSRLVVGAVGLAIGGWAVPSRAQPATGCDSDQLAEIFAIYQTEPDEPALQFLGPEGEPAADPVETEPATRSFDFTAQVVALACALPPELEQMCNDVATVPPDARPLVILRGVSANLNHLGRVCYNAPSYMSAASALPPAEQSASFVDACNLGRLELATREELVDVEFHRLLGALAIYSWASAEGVPEARQLGRMLAGLTI